MKRIACEMCGSNDVMKTEGLYVCQNCGTKYSVEEARKLMIEGVVDVSGSKVKIDTSDDLNNLYTLARRARKENDLANQWKYYEMIEMRDPYSWEAYFYYRISKLLENNDVDKLKEATNTVLGLIWESWDKDKNDKKAIIAVNEVFARYDEWVRNHLESIDERFFRNLKIAANRKEEKKFRENYYIAVIQFENLLLLFGDSIEAGFAEVKALQQKMVAYWKWAIAVDVEALPYFRKEDKDMEEEEMRLTKYIRKIMKYDPAYIVPEVKKKRISSIVDWLLGEKEV